MRLQKYFYIIALFMIVAKTQAQQDTSKQKVVVEAPKVEKNGSKIFLFVDIHKYATTDY